MRGLNTQKKGKWLVYGTGSVAKQALGFAALAELPVSLAGRNAISVHRLATANGVPGQKLDLDEDIKAALQGYLGILNLAGPYQTTAPRLLEASLKAGIHYVDVSNDLSSHKLAWASHGRATTAGIGIVAGAGMGTCHSELLLNLLAQRANAELLEATLIMLPSGSSHKSSAVQASYAALLSEDGAEIKDHILRAVRGVERVHRLESWAGVGAGIVMATGDIVAISQTLPMKNISVMAAVDADPSRVRVLFDQLTCDARRKPLDQVGAPPNQQWEQQLTQAETQPQVRLLGEITTRSGQSVRGQLIAGSGTSAAAAGAVEVARAISENGLVGTHTAYQVLAGRMPLAKPSPRVVILDH
ncbi:hypothetical protein EDF62_1622 [Leucobacter luti]|uniref:Saccharopine dehydrogenase-like protein n=1 Tax=Leucobacter luti TaxID=340320 RepID=A0A4R6S1B1_9MICO|nr:hypothetical protein EDF62_1622 [Leucobacter luti]